MNKDKFLELADVIEKVKPENFSMGAFFGKKIAAYESENWEEISEDVEAFSMVTEHDPYFKLSNLKDIVESNENTIKINCDTTACIAGWAIINEWARDSNFYDKEYIESLLVGQVVTTAKEILGISYPEAMNLFYCEVGSVWDRLANDYPEGISFLYDYAETWNLDNKVVAKVLRQIANGEISILTNEDEEDEYYGYP